VETAPTLEKLVFAKNNELACNACNDKNLNEDERQTYGLMDLVQGCTMLVLKSYCTRV